MVNTAIESAPLSADETATLDKLLARAAGAPDVRIGEAYVALICLSVPRRGDKDRQTDLVHPGEIVHLTDEEARQFNRHGSRDGRQVDVVRKVSGPGGTHEPPQLVLPRAVSGRLFRPGPPPPGSDAPRPDPEGSSAVQFLAGNGNAPEGAEPMRPEPSEMADQLREVPDAADLPPRRARTGR